jgi:hypothetical protein
VFRRLTPFVIVILAAVAHPAAAQGHGNGAGKGRKTPTAAETSGTSASTTGAPVITGGVREFGTWLDDASIVDPGGGWLSIAFGHYNSPGSHQTDFPVADAAFGVNRRLQIGMTLPYSHYGFPDGNGASGRGDVYLNAKIPLSDPGTARDHRGLAMTPMIEILSEPDPIHGGRVFWGVPISAEMRVDRARLYGSTGYFSRGVFFGSGALEFPAARRVIATAALTWAHSLSSDTIAETTGLSATRIDLSGGAAYVLTPRIAAFGSIGRTVSHVDANASTLMLNGGVSITFSGTTHTKPHR